MYGMVCLILLWFSIHYPSQEESLPGHTRQHTRSLIHSMQPPPPPLQSRLFRARAAVWRLAF